MANGPDGSEGSAKGEAEKDGDATKARQGTGMQMPFLAGNCNPATANREIANVARQHEG